MVHVTNPLFNSLNNGVTMKMILKGVIKDGYNSGCDDEDRTMEIEESELDRHLKITIGGETIVVRQSELIKITLTF